MKKIIYLLLLLPFTCVAADSWYRVTVIDGSEPYNFYGRVKYTPDEFANALNDNHVIKISSLVYFDSQNRVKSWSEWAPHMKPEAYIKSSVISMFIPLTGNPIENDK